MGADSLFNDDFDADEARYDRRNRLNPPEFQPGQGDDFDMFSSGFDSPVGSGGFDTFSSGGSAFNDPFGGGFGQPQMQQQSNTPQTDEDKFYDALSKGGKGLIGFFKDVVNSFKGLTPKFISVYGKNSTIAGLITAVVGLILRVFGVNFGIQLCVGGLLTSAVGVVSLMFFVEKGSQCSSQYSDDNTTNPNFSTPPSLQLEPEMDFGGDFSNDFDFNEDFDNDEDPYSEGESDFNFDFDDEPYSGGSLLVEEPVDTETALSELPEIDKGTYTRQYLYDMFVKVLPHLKPDFADVKSYDEDSDIFLQWEESLREAAGVSGCKEEDLPDLISLDETLLTIRITCTRTKGLKTDVLAKEIANIYAYRDGEFNDRVYAIADTSGSKCIITLYTGETALVSLRDMYSHIKDDILSTKNYMPVVLGIDQAGKVIWCDFKKIESCIVAGMPRSGKSWLVQAILTQMCAYVSPRELNIYIFDPKAGTSDFRSFTLPHVKKFATRYKNEQGNIVNPEGIDMLTTLTQIVRVEAPRRKKLLGDAKCVNIWDFRKKYPDVDLPLLYVVIDEAVTLAEDMEKEDKKEYQSYVTQLITQFPNLGIRAFLIPHVVKDQIIKKTATDSVKCRISVKGSPDHIESSTGTKPRDFKYKLCNVGDMAVNIPDIKQQTMFVHGVALTDDNEKNAELFDYLRRVWSKLEQDEVQNSVSVQAEEDKANEELLVKVNNLSDSDTADLSTSEEEDLFSNEVSGLDEDLFSNSGSANNLDDDFLRDFM